MSEYNNIIIIVLVGLAFYLFYNYEKKKMKDNKIKILNKNDQYADSPEIITQNMDFDFRDDIKPRTFDYLSSMNGKNSYVSYKGKQYPYKVDLINDPDDEIVTNQYHPDYMRVVAYLNSRNKQTLFNFACLPIIEKSVAEKKDVFPIVNRFVYELSKKTDTGLKLVDMVRIKKFIIEDQEKYQCDVILQKDAPVPSNVKMIVRMSYVYNTDDTVDETDFFEKAWANKLAKRPLVDEINIVGYATNTYDIESQAQTEYYAFNNVEDERFMEEGDINRVVASVRKKHAMENGCLNTDWDEDGRKFYFPDKPSKYTNPDGDLSATNWGQTNRRNTPSKYEQDPRTDNLYPSIGTSVNI
jgi:hypothetical protein